MRDDLVVIAREELLEYRTAARKKPMGVATLGDSLARSVCPGKRIAFEHSDGGIEI